MDYTVHEDENGRLVFDTEEESEYPWGLCKAYARGLLAQMRTDGILRNWGPHYRAKWFETELELSTQRLAESAVNLPVAMELAILEEKMLPGEEQVHLQEMLRQISYRGTDLRLVAVLTDEAETQHEFPYPAQRWDWRTVMSFPWAQEAHINELEMCAILATTKHRGRSTAKFHQRWFHIVDSMVSRGVLAKGRSSSRRLNRVMRKNTASLLAQNSYQVPMWTISRWNFADDASRRFEK